MNEPEDLPRTAVVLIAHGSRRPEANADLVTLGEMVRERSGFPVVEIGYLELAEPTIPQALQRCVARQAKRVLMLPYFLAAGSHVVDDLEQFRQEAAKNHPQVSFQLCPPLGLHPLMVELVLTRLAEGLDGK